MKIRHHLFFRALEKRFLADSNHIILNSIEFAPHTTYLYTKALIIIKAKLSLSFVCNQTLAIYYEPLISLLAPAAATTCGMPCKPKQ